MSSRSLVVMANKCGQSLRIVLASGSVSEQFLVQAVHQTDGNASGFVLGEVEVGSEQRGVSDCEASSWHSNGNALVPRTFGIKVAVPSLLQGQFKSDV